MNKNNPLQINLNDLEQAKEFRTWLYKINEWGIDRTMDLIEDSIKMDGIPSYFTLAHSVFSKTDKVEYNIVKSEDLAPYGKQKRRPKITLNVTKNEAKALSSLAKKLTEASNKNDL